MIVKREGSRIQDIRRQVSDISDEQVKNYLKEVKVTISRIDNIISQAERNFSTDVISQDRFDLQKRAKAYDYFISDVSHLLRTLKKFKGLRKQLGPYARKVEDKLKILLEALRSKSDSQVFSVIENLEVILVKADRMIYTTSLSMRSRADYNLPRANRSRIDDF